MATSPALPIKTLESFQKSEDLLIWYTFNFVSCRSAYMIFALMTHIWYLYSEQNIICRAERCTRSSCAILQRTASRAGQPLLHSRPSPPVLVPVRHVNPSIPKDTALLKYYRKLISALGFSLNNIPLPSLASPSLTDLLVICFSAQ